MAPRLLSAVERRLYNQRVVLSEGATPALRTAADALRSYLGTATGVRFEVSTSGSKGIFLLRSDAPDAPADIVGKLRDAGPEAYFARSNSDGRLLIVANDDRGLIFGAYQTLERLGVRFYFPSERWTIVPHLRDIEQPVEQLVKPDFRMRVMAGTGGFGKGLPGDPHGELQQRWELWKLENGFGEEFHIGGHAGESFNNRYKETLIAHPDYLASVAGKRVGWSRGAKLDPTNADAVELFVQDRLEAYRAQRSRDPDGPGSFAISVEPADGGGHCDSPECARIGGPSDQEFFLANAVARALAKEFPGAHASLFAYNYHSDVPHIAIEPNVYVTLIPYAFRHDGSDPETFIKAWSKKKTPLSIYDYWSIPDWVADAPVFDYRNTVAKKLRFWHEQQIEGLISETTYSAGAMGLAWYIAAHLMWDTRRDSAALADEFFRDCFADAAPSMRRMLERWAAGFLLTNAELHSSFADLADALTRARSADVTARIVDYAGYVQYLRLRHEWEGSSGAERRERERALVLHLWRLYATGMVDTFRLQRLLLRDDKEQLAAELDPSNLSLPVWKSISPIDLAEARRLVQAGLRDFPNVDVKIKNYAGDLVAAEVAASSALAPALPALAAAPTQVTFVGPNRVELSVPNGMTSIEVQVSSSTPVQARIVDHAQRELAATPLAPTGTSRALSVAVTPGNYVLDLRAPRNGRVLITLPAGVGVELQEFRVPVSAPAPDLYFYVPKGEKRVGIHSVYKIQPGDKHGPSLLNPSGAIAAAEITDEGHVLMASVPPGADGKIWVLRGAVAPAQSLRLLNAPQRFALSPGALRVPRGALSPAMPPSPPPASSQE